MYVHAAQAVVHAVAREQHLGGDVAVLAEQLVVYVHQLALAHGSAGLPAADIVRTALQFEFAHAHANGARGDEHDLVPGVFQIRQHARQIAHAPKVQLARFMRQRRSAHLEYEALRASKMIHFRPPSYSCKSASSKPARTMLSGSCENIELMDS